MRSRGERVIQKVQKSTADEQQKRYVLFKKLFSQSSEQFREIDANDFDLNITERIEETEEIDEAVTPLIYAAYFGTLQPDTGLKEITRSLLTNKRVDVDMETESNRQTPLLTACLCGNYEIVRLLLLAKAEPNKPNLLNQSPLAATLFRLVEEPTSFENRKICFLIAELLVKYGADPNWVIDKKQGFSLLHYFCGLKVKMNKAQKQLNRDIICFLLEKGADNRQLTLTDRSIEDLLESHCNKEELLELLKSYRQGEKIPKTNLDPSKRIDPNFFKIDLKK